MIAILHHLDPVRPSRDQQLADIRDACIRANHEIVELRFGCVVQYKGYSKPFIFLRTTRGDKHSVLTQEAVELKIHIGRGFKIKGRPIRLADVLLAMDKPVKYHTILATVHANVANVLYLWNLPKDDITLQSDACVAFVHGLLAKK